MIIHSPAPSSALQQLGTSDMRLMFSGGGKKEFIQLLPDKSVVLPFVIDCKLERTDSESGQYNTSCSVVVSLCCSITVIKCACKWMRMHISYSEVLF